MINIYKKIKNCVRNSFAKYLYLYISELPKDIIEKMISSGELFIIPAGLRCYTKGQLNSLLGVKQESLPFDSGFFSPHAIASVIKHKRISLDYLDTDTQCPCIKTENYIDESHGKGVRFISSTYNEIDSCATSKDKKDINKYLDSTFGYYTLDKKNKFVLAHYNWHNFASFEKSNGEYDKKNNIENINNILNRRIERMFERCNNAKYIIFVVFENQKYKYISINDEYFYLNDYSKLICEMQKTFGKKCLVIKIKEIDTHFKLLTCLKLIDNQKYEKIAFTFFKPFVKGRAFRLYKNGRLYEAELLSYRFILHSPNTAWAYYILGKVQWQRGEHTLALENLEKAIALEPKTEYFRTFKKFCLRKLHIKK